MQMAFYFDQTRCTGCYTCVVSCKDWHDVPPGRASWMRVMTLEKGKYPDLFAAHLTLPCFHCAEPACVTACPVGAITKRQSDGVVVVDRELCSGHDNCDMCLQVCPYDAPQFGTESNAKMQKCDFCLDRLGEGKLPICVASCPMRALDSGPLEALAGKYGSGKEAEGFAFDVKMEPSVVFKPKQDERRLTTRRIVTVP
jgi:anaerobic dimethyl sulfoxide reductase subunit B (iron-sulfur subunit)